MLKRPITYTNFNDEEVTEQFYFNISKSEILKLEAEEKGGFQAYIQGVIEAEDNKTLIHWFEKILLLAHGVKSADGKRFDKSDEIRENFRNSAAYDALFWEITQNEGKAAEFIDAVLPAEARKAAAAAMAETKDISTVGPTPPTPPTT